MTQPRNRSLLSRLRGNASQYFVMSLILISIGSIVIYEVYFPHGPHKLGVTLLSDQGRLPPVVPKIGDLEDDIEKEDSNFGKKPKQGKYKTENEKLYKKDEQEGGENEGFVSFYFLIS